MGSNLEVQYTNISKFIDSEMIHMVKNWWHCKLLVKRKSVTQLKFHTQTTWAALAKTRNMWTVLRLPVPSGTRRNGSWSSERESWDNAEGTPAWSVESLTWALPLKHEGFGEMMWKSQREAGGQAAIISRSAQPRNSVRVCLWSGSSYASSFVRPLSQ